MTLSKKELRLINALESMTNLPEILGKALEDSVITQTYMKQKVEEYFEKQPETADIFYKALQQIGQEKITQQVEKKFRETIENNKPIILNEKPEQNYKLIGEFSIDGQIQGVFYQGYIRTRTLGTGKTITLFTQHSNHEHVATNLSNKLKTKFIQESLEKAVGFKADAMYMNEANFTITKDENAKPDSHHNPIEVYGIQNVFVYKKDMNR
ncbi:MAG: hypothetical protein KKB65_02645 [Nanoarchaeota archaeon]|nr:hypothetical protein [Nanoarchaeota archaeon]MBU1030106.1 hypothetical protein [Nanoarchaeota archaeon]MBU1849989.1 hypothetical protein [Nanoarchaeota archaeon]